MLIMQSLRLSFNNVILNMCKNLIKVVIVSCFLNYFLTKKKKSTLLNQSLFYKKYIRLFTKFMLYCLTLHTKNLLRLTYFFFELELFFISDSVFVLIFFVYSILNRLLFIFIFVLLCIIVNQKTLFLKKACVF